MKTNALVNGMGSVFDSTTKTNLLGIVKCLVHFIDHCSEVITVYNS